MVNTRPIPNDLRNFLGVRHSEAIEEDIRLSARVDAITQTQSLSLVRRFASATKLLFTGDVGQVPATVERTYRGPNYGSPMPLIGDWKPNDWLKAEIVDQMKKNGVIKTALFLKKAPILAVVQKSHIKHEVPRIEAYLNYVMGPILFDLCVSSLFALDYGVSLHEKVFKAEKISFKYEQSGVTRTFNGNSIHYKKIKWNNPRTIKRINIQDRTQDYDGYVQEAGAREIPIPVDYSFMWGKNQENSLWGSSELDSVYEYWYWLELLSGYYMRYMEKLGTPPMIGYAPYGTTYSRDEDKAVENLSWLAEIAGRFQDGMAIVMPAQFDPNSRNRLWELREMALSSRGDLYGNAISWLENAIFKGMFVPDKPVSQGTQSFGSYALADIQFEAFLVGEDWDLHSLVYNIEKYVLRPLLDLNFGPNVADAKLFYPPMSRELKQRVYEIFKDLVEKHPDFTSINFVDIADELGIPRYTAEELTKKKEEAVADAQAMFKATTPETPVTPTDKAAKDNSTTNNSIQVNPIVQPLVDLSGIREELQEGLDDIRETVEGIEIPEQPQPEKPKKKVFEYDDRGRIMSVREIDEE